MARRAITVLILNFGVYASSDPQMRGYVVLSMQGAVLLVALGLHLYTEVRARAMRRRAAAATACAAAHHPPPPSRSRS